MIIDFDGTLRNISAKITKEELDLARAYIQGAVHSHCNTVPDEELSARILFGGDNRNWKGTPLQAIFDYHNSISGKTSYDNAAKDVGWLLKSVLAEDTRTFEVVGEYTGKKYKLVK